MYLGLVLMRRLYPEELSHLSIRLWELVAVAFCLESLLFPLPWCMRMLPAFQLSGLLALSTVAYRLTYALRHGRPFARIILLCVFLYMAGGVHDALVTNGKIGAWAELQAPSLLLFLGVQAWALASSYASSQGQVLTLSRDLLRTNDELSARNRELTLTNQSVARFVPHEFLAQLERSSIGELQRGDHASRHMEVLFCDVRGFTGLVESMQPGQAFAFINDFLSFMEPAIHRHGGFINQYLGDCIMALFPNGSEAALSAALDMQAQLALFNAEGRHSRGPVAMGIGINSGPLMLGTIGGEQRLASGVVGDAVNLAARLEQLTKLYGSTLILSELTVRGLPAARKQGLRWLDLVIVRGKTQAIRIYECLDGLPADERASKLATRARFEQGMQQALAHAFEDALESFEACLSVWPGDSAAQLHRRRCQDALRGGNLSALAYEQPAH
jgi:adenylate cyclase